MINKFKRAFDYKIKAKKFSIKVRILASIICLITIVFLAIILSFNILLDKYVKSSSSEQLTRARLSVEKISDLPRPLKPPNDRKMDEPKEFSEFMRNVQEKVRLAEIESDANAMVVNSKYDLVFPNRYDDYLKDIDEMENINKWLKRENFDLKSKNNIKVSTTDRDYYISSVDISNQNESKDQYLIMFIDTTSTMNLAKWINLVLILIMCVAEVMSIIIALLLSEKIASPIKELSSFAKHIGEGDFRTIEKDYSDEELSELFKVMNKSAEYLDKYDKEQKTFFQNASHELRTPLMSIKGYAEAIKYNVIEKGEASEIILEESDRLSEMVEDLLYISKVDNITKSYILTECDLREVLSNCCIKLNAKAKNSKIEFIYDFESKTVLYKCDEKHLTRAFFNLIENSLRYAHNNIFIRCKCFEDQISIEIEDDGSGISNEDLPYIFDRFYKGEGGKHGIGLSIVESIIEKHSGAITASNGKLGAVFLIEFPKVQL
ncbi:sensor histidine kinase [Metaclostridioides mangenotii]|uniref:HAMP domain-containing sensor histidine kinase n=1 Tax=Metaclostridioides mangenotii TaxID=1540 RepID=UPI0026EC5976|nr:HAMP domain-containing sensor histidine kinase [Clostridioides mangenotii]